ncbi:MAG: hypothetical protein R3C68_17220 [Myxococcota bacterium]
MTRFRYDVVLRVGSHLSVPGSRHVAEVPGEKVSTREALELCVAQQSSGVVVRDVYNARSCWPRRFGT